MHACGFGLCVQVCVCGTRLVSVRDASRVWSWCEYEDFEEGGGVVVQSPDMSLRACENASFSQLFPASQPRGKQDSPGFRGFGGQGMVLSPQQTINHTPPPSQHVQHLQPTHTPLPIEVGTLQHPHPKAVSTVTTYIRKFGQMNPLQAQALSACLLPLSFSLGTCVCMPLRGALQRQPARWRPLGEPRRVRQVRPRWRRRATACTIPTHPPRTSAAAARPIPSPRF